MDSMHYTDESYCKSFMSQLDQLWVEASYTDVILKVEDMAIKCHKVVLCAGSSYFSAMFSSGLEEETKTEVEMKGIDAASCLSLLGYLYTGQVEVNIHNAQELVHSSDLLQLDSVKNTCENFMLKHVQPSNCIGFCNFANLYGLKQLRSKARSCMLEKFTEVIKSSEFADLAKDNLIEYITDDKICISNENIVFEGVMTWINGNLDDRQKLFPAIAEHVRFPFCTASYLCEVVYKNSFMGTPECQMFLQEAISYHMMFGQENRFISPRTAPRDSFAMSKHFLVFGGFVKSKSEPNEFIWSTKEGSSSWEVLSELPSNIGKYHSVCVVPGGIIVTGGKLEKRAVRDCWFFEMVGKKWTCLPPMSVFRRKHRSLIHDNAVFVFGGVCGNKTLDSVEKFDLKQHEWTSVHPMLRPVRLSSVVAFRSSIYVFGGLDGDLPPLPLTQEYDTVNNVWHLRTRMPRACRGTAAVNIGDTIYILAGYIRGCFSYEPLFDIWTTLASPERIHGFGPALVWGDKILISGGDLGEEGFSSEIEQYDPTSNTWSDWDMELPTELFMHHAFNIAVNSWNKRSDC